jgi:UDP-glucuronate 4-epimerase
MSMFLFTQKIIDGEPIDVFNNGHHSRDFTYVGDIVAGVVRCCDRIAAPNPGWSGDRPDPGTSAAPYRLYNIGNHSPIQLLDYIRCIEKEVGKPARMNFLPMQPGEVPATFADVSDLQADIGFEPKTRIEDGVKRFVAWYREFYRK